MKQPLLCSCLLFLSFLLSSVTTLLPTRPVKTVAPYNVPYPLSTNPDCGDPDYSLHCDGDSQKLYFDGLNGSSCMPDLHTRYGFTVRVVKLLEASSVWTQQNLPSHWEEGIEIEWAPAPEPVCKTQLDCTTAPGISHAPPCRWKMVSPAPSATGVTPGTLLA